MEDKNTFLDWYLGGSDQEREATMISLAEYVIAQLREKGEAELSVNTLVEGSDVEEFERWLNHQTEGYTFVNFKLG
jgi:hypothetical protein